MKVAIILPVRNEIGILERNAKRVWTWGREAFGDDVALVLSENGSTDGTTWLVRALERLLPGCVATVSKAPGKGGAIKRAAAAVEADAYLFMDADLSTDLASAAALVEDIREGSDVAIASRRALGAETKRSWRRAWSSTLYAMLTSRVLKLPIRDFQCGCKAFSRRVRDELLPTVRDDGFFFDTEFLARAARSGARIAERGVRWDEWSVSGRKSGVKVLRMSWVFLGKLAALHDDLA